MIWSTVPEIWSVTEWNWPFWVIFCPLTPLKTNKIRIWKNEKNCFRYHHFTDAYQNHAHMIYGSWDKQWNGQSFLPFEPPTPLNDPENQNFEKMKKASGDIIIFYKCTINRDHICCIVPEIWRVTDVSSLSHFELFFALLPPWRSEKSKFLKNEKNGLET